jgi:hypothetical protein
VAIKHSVASTDRQSASTGRVDRRSLTLLKTLADWRVQDDAVAELSRARSRRAGVLMVTLVLLECRFLITGKVYGLQTGYHSSGRG